MGMVIFTWKPQTFLFLRCVNVTSKRHGSCLLGIFSGNFLFHPRDNPVASFATMIPP